MLILTWVCIILSRSWPTGICETSCYTWFALKVQTITFKLHMSLTTNDFELFMHMWDVADALSLLEEKMFGDPKFSNWNVKGNKIVMVIHFSSLEIMLSFYCITQPLHDHSFLIIYTCIYYLWELLHCCGVTSYF